jgi:hypothetical protein
MILASDPLAPFGQAAGIILALYTFVSILIGLALAAGLMFGLAWVREKSELVKKLRPMVDKVNTTTESAMSGTLPPAQPGDKQIDKIARIVAEGPMVVQNIDKQVDQGSERVARAVIEFRARTMMVKTIAKAFFLPGLTRREPDSALEKAGVDFKSPGYKMLMEQAAPQGSTAVGDGYVGAVGAHQLKQVGAPGTEEPKVTIASASSSADVGAQQLKALDIEEANKSKNAPVR